MSRPVGYEHLARRVMGRKSVPQASGGAYSGVTSERVPRSVSHDLNSPLALPAPVRPHPELSDEPGTSMTSPL